MIFKPFEARTENTYKGYQFAVFLYNSAVTIIWLMITLLSFIINIWLGLLITLLMITTIIVALKTQNNNTLISKTIYTISPVSDIKRLKKYQTWRKANRFLKEVEATKRPYILFEAFLEEQPEQGTITLTIGQQNMIIRYEKLEQIANDTLGLMDATNTTVKKVAPGKHVITWYKSWLEQTLKENRKATMTDIIGRTKNGSDYRLDILNPAWHTIISGQTRSGKTVALYTILAQLAHKAKTQPIIIGGIDPSAITLAPFEDANYKGEQYRALGLKSMAKIVSTITAVTQELDRRLNLIREQGTDQLTPSTQNPPIVFVLEEYPALIASADNHDRSVNLKDRIAPTIKNGIQRLLAESAKCGITLIIVMQRADSTIIGGFERSNIPRRIQLRMDNKDGVRMLLPEASNQTIETITQFTQGYALIAMPGEEEQIIKFDILDYAQYREIVMTK